MLTCITLRSIWLRLVHPWYVTLEKFVLFSEFRTTAVLQRQRLSGLARMIDLWSVAYMSPLITQYVLAISRENDKFHSLQRVADVKCAGTAKMLSISDSRVVFTAEKKNTSTRWILAGVKRRKGAVQRRRERSGGSVPEELVKCHGQVGSFVKLAQIFTQSTRAWIEHYLEVAPRIRATLRSARKNNYCRRRNLIMFSHFRRHT